MSFFTFGILYISPWDFFVGASCKSSYLVPPSKETFVFVNFSCGILSFMLISDVFNNFFWTGYSVLAIP
jgi:hypothetical protein